MDRRGVLKLGAGFGAAIALGARPNGRVSAQSLPDEGVLAKAWPKDWVPFSEEGLIEMARRLAAAPFAPPKEFVKPPFATIDYDQYRAIRFKKDLAIWGKDNLGFNLELFSAGYIYKTPVKLHVVENGKAGELLYDPRLFTYGPEAPPIPEDANPGFSGFRIHSPIDRPDLYDEYVVFQGASYFRSKAAGQDYGISARGLALNTAKPPADEFPVFTDFWIVKPGEPASSITVYALLDTVSAAGAYKFVISNRHNTIMDVDCTIFPRATLKFPGIAPLTSMFFFAPSNSFRADEVRPRIHDSDGLSIYTGKGEWIWRPLVNTNQIQYSSFLDNRMKGFGLLQRERRPDRYQDFDARYETRPSVWVEPLDDWGEGSVDLIELPTTNEYADNIVAYWHPKSPVEAGRGSRFRYRLTWCYEPPVTDNLATIMQTLVGASTQHPGMRLFYIDFIGTEKFALCDEYAQSCADKLANVELSTSAGAIVNVAFRRNKITGGHRLGFEYDPARGVLAADLRAVLVSEGKPVSESWVYRWTA